MNDEEIGPWQATGRPALSPRRFIRPPVIRLKRRVRPTLPTARPIVAAYPYLPCLSVFTPTQQARRRRLPASYRASSCSHKRETEENTVDLEVVKKTLLKLNRSPKPFSSLFAHYSSASLLTPALSPREAPIPTPRLRYRKQPAWDRERRELNSWDCGVIAEQWNGAINRTRLGTERKKSRVKKEERKEKKANLGEVLGNMLWG